MKQSVIRFYLQSIKHSYSSCNKTIFFSLASRPKPLQIVVSLMREGKQEKNMFSFAAQTAYCELMFASRKPYQCEENQSDYKWPWGMSRDSICFGNLKKQSNIFG